MSHSWNMSAKALFCLFSIRLILSINKKSVWILIKIAWLSHGFFFSFFFYLFASGPTKRSTKQCCSQNQRFIAWFSSSNRMEELTVNVFYVFRFYFVFFITFEWYWAEFASQILECIWILDNSSSGCDWQYHTRTHWHANGEYSYFLFGCNLRIIICLERLGKFCGRYWVYAFRSTKGNMNCSSWTKKTDNRLCSYFRVQTS